MRSLEDVSSMNEMYSAMSVRRRYEVWFIRMGLADGSGAWWFRYLLMNPSRGGCAGDTHGAPVQVWATWFPRGEKPQTFIQGYTLDLLHTSRRKSVPFHLEVDRNRIDEIACCGKLEVDGHSISWNLQYESTFRATLSDKGWIGFSRTPHSDAVFSGEVVLDGRRFSGQPLGFGVQGHNCGYRHRNFWTWSHAYFSEKGKHPSTLETLTYEMPLGLVFRKAVFYHSGQVFLFRNLKERERNRESMHWSFECQNKGGVGLEAFIDGSGPSIHRLPYLKTDCGGRFEVSNNSLASAMIVIQKPGGQSERLYTSNGAVLEMVG